jgi:hypothetical protein
MRFLPKSPEYLNAPPVSQEDHDRGHSFGGVVTDEAIRVRLMILERNLRDSDAALDQHLANPPERTQLQASIVILAKAANMYRQARSKA